MTADVVHLPPQSLEAEEAILGAMLMSTVAIEIALELGLAERDFYRPSHRTIFRTILTLFDRGSVDELTVVSDLQREGNLGDVGGPAAVTSLAERVPAIANARAYAQEVIDQSAFRRTVETGHAIADLGYQRKLPPLKLVAEAGRLVDDLATTKQDADAEWTTFGDELEPLIDALQDRKDRGDAIVGVPSGVDVLDSRWGGLQNARLYIGAGRPGMGKSAWLSGVCEHVALAEGKHVALFNFEMNAEQQAKRGVARLGNANLHNLTSGLPSDADMVAVAETRQRIYGDAKRLHINRRAFLTMQQIAQSARRLHRTIKRNGGDGLGMIGLDYLQLVETHGARRGDNRANDLSEISRGLKSLAMELDIPVIALSQLNRSVESRTPPRPILSDLRESGAIEQDADVVLLLYRPEYYLKDETPLEWQSKAEAITAKWRDGVPGTDVVGWDGPRTKFVHAREARHRPFVVGGSEGEIT